MSATSFILSQTGISATPLLLAGYGELLAQRAGIINVGIEGTMLMGTVAAFTAAALTGSVWAALPAAIAAGLLMAALFALATVWFRADQIVTGTALNILALGASSTIWLLFQSHTKARDFTRSAFFEALPETLLSQYPLLFVALACAVALILLMRYTRVGLVVRALGDAPDACHAAGISVRLWRTSLLLTAGALSGIAGMYLSTMRTQSFVENMTDGKGFLVLALVIFGRWNILYFTLGTFAFSAVDGLQVYFKTSNPLGIPHQLFEMMPYVATLFALTLLAKSRSGPIHLGKSWPE